MSDEKINRTDAIAKFMKERALRLSDKVKSKEFRKRGERAGLAVAAALGASTLPIWFLERNPDYKYLDDEKTIETEAVLAAAGVTLGLMAYVWDVGGDETGEVALVAGLTLGANYISEMTRQKARKEVAEEAALAAQQAAAA